MRKIIYGEVAYHRQGGTPLKRWEAECVRLATAYGGAPPKAEKAFFMYYVYIIKSETTERYYTGITSDLAQRLRHHNSGANRSTKNKGPRVVAHREEFNDKKTAWLREGQIKKYKGGEAFKKLIQHGRVA